ncbi:hypothetical protein [Vibrio nigripulchritudo]|uniref:hypothetical protein n=1 Tax=Vibrio nigripulchritudo TaxID=28173 RepID=UPI0003B2365F|nr:hypothetical protein [Vibrio nigripulchritudo]CCN69887.1 conserved hypothetical protein [Vibrio nigripulchritudo SFn118]
MKQTKSVFNSKQPQKQRHPQDSQSSFTFLNIVGEEVPHTEPQEDVAFDLLKEFKPSEIKKGEKNFWSEKELSTSRLVSIAQVFYYAYLLSKTGAIIFSVLTFIISLGSFFVNGFIDGFYTFLDINIDNLIYLISPLCGIWAISLFLLKKLIPRMARKNYVLNRETGMVTLYDKDEDIIYSHPFIEFDCRLVSTPNQYGHLSFGIVLIHRYCDYSQHVCISDMITSGDPDDQKRLWNVIQQYMDVSQPLPDLPILEPFRSKDPTTTAYDKEIGRDPNYWRSMSDKEFEQMVENQKRIPPLGKPINIYAQTPEEIHVV